MLTTGNQLRAARALAGLKQDQLAKLAGLNTSTISEMEAMAGGVLTSGMDTVHRVVRALDAVGIQATNYDGRLGVEIYAVR
jgi:transcriptional regulator with XRE-family HTH domain